ncbi:MAG: hypothetical protein GX987_10055 [Tissierellia bacterium]|nr:hypothetical protein [Tissierellia bacterium]
MDNNKELFKREYYCEWIRSKEYQEAHKLWLWYNYHCELYDSKICTGSNEYEDYIPVSGVEFKLINQNAIRNLKHIQKERENLKYNGVNISDKDWNLAKKHFYNYKLKALEEEYKYYFQ